MIRPNMYFVLAVGAFIAITAVVSSCIKDEPKNQECDILSAWVEGSDYSEYFYQPSQMRLESIPSADKEIVFSVKSLLSLPESVPVSFSITPGATIEPASGTVQNFKAGPVTYTVTSEDGAWQRRYSVAFKETSLPTYRFSFENVEVVEGFGENFYHEFYELGPGGERYNIWASGNPGAVLIKYGTSPEDQPTYSTEAGYQGKGVCLNTQEAGTLGQLFGKPIAAGNLFMGHFLMEEVLINPLKSTQFGQPVSQAPLRVTGYYKYRPGDTFTNSKKETVPGRVDEASIYAVFYRNKDDAGNDVFLYGDDVLTSPYLVRKAEVETLPPTDEWTPFEMFFEGGEVDSRILSEQGYSLALVFSSSKDGAAFEGAIGSTLSIDEVEVFFEEEDEDDE